MVWGGRKCCGIIYFGWVFLSPSECLTQHPGWGGHCSLLYSELDVPSLDQVTKLVVTVLVINGPHDLELVVVQQTGDGTYK